MGINIGGMTVSQVGSANLVVNTGVSMTLTTTGGVLRPNQTQFIATGNGSGGWVYWTTETTWNKIPFPSAPVNINSCFDTTNARFTAPVTGWYLFEACCGHVLKDNASDGYYIHPTFWVNGNAGTRLVNTTYPAYRIGGHGMPVGTYMDSEVRQAYPLVAGDYVEHYIFSSGGWNGSTGTRYYQPYCRFTGFLLG